LIISKRT